MGVGFVLLKNKRNITIDIKQKANTKADKRGCYELYLELGGAV